MSSSSAEILLSNSLSLSSDSCCPFCIRLKSCSMRRKRWRIWALSARWLMLGEGGFRAEVTSQLNIVKHMLFKPSFQG